MDISKKSRTELKAFFVKNAIPTESNFSDLIDAMLNQKEDGVAKLAGNPLSIEATGDATSLRKAINFYESFADANPSWSISLNPRIQPNDPASSNPGFTISDASGTNCLFIDRSSKNVGIGTVDPKGALDVQADPRTGTHPKNRILYVTGNSQEADGIEFRHSNGSQGIGFGYNTIYATGSNADQDLKLVARGKGNVVVGGGLQVTDNITIGQLKVQNGGSFTTISNDGGRLHISGGELLYLLNKSGVIVGKEWGGTGNLTVEGQLFASNSDIYFMNTSHNHTGIANAAGCAAIENGANYGGLMILGRTVSTNPLRRVVKIWDYLEMNGEAVKPGGGGWGALSDERLKKNITGLQGALDKLLNLRGVSFEWNDPEKHANQTGSQVGLVAQEVEQVFPEWIGTDTEGFKFITVRGFEALVIEALRELKSDFEGLRKQLSHTWPPSLASELPGQSAEQ